MVCLCTICEAYVKMERIKSLSCKNRCAEKNSANFRELFSGFKRLKTKEQRLNFFLNYFNEQELITEEDVEGYKCLSKSIQLRKEGNDAFKLRNYDKAVILYTKSIAFAPYPSVINGQENESDSSFAFAVANRSTVLFELKKYELCLKDTLLAFAANYPKHLHFKLRMRQINCLAALGKKDDLLLQVSLASLDLADNLPDEKRKILKNEIENSFSCIKNLPTGNGNVNSLGLTFDVNTDFNENEYIPGASDSVELKTTDNMGRGLFATKDIKIGDIIVWDKPFAWALKEEFFYTHCDYCHKPYMALIPCPYCSVVMYCNEKCLMDAWNMYHEFECCLLPIILHVGIHTDSDYTGIVALRTVFRAANMFDSLLEFHRSVKQFDQSGHNYNEYYFAFHTKNDYSPYFPVYKMLTNEKYKSIEQILDYCVFSAFLTTLLDERTCFFSRYSNHSDGETMAELIMFIASLLLRHIQNRSYEIVMYEKIPIPRCIEAPTIGYGIYATASLFNHHCDPNSFHYNVIPGKDRITRCLRDIKKGEQIFDAYELYFVVHEIEYRHMALTNEFYFTCHCVPCIEDWPQLEVLQFCEQKMKCQFCKNVIPVKQEIGSGLKTCGNCHRQNDFNPVILKMREINMFITRTHRKNSEEELYNLSEITSRLRSITPYICRPHHLLFLFEKFVRVYFCLSTVDY